MYVPHQIAYLFTYSFDDNNARYPWLDYLLVMLSTVSTPELCFGWITISKMGILATTVEYSDSVYTVHNKQEARTSSSCFCNTSLCDKKIYWVKFFCYNYKSSTDWVIATHFFGHSDFRLFAVEWYLEL